MKKYLVTIEVEDCESSWGKYEIAVNSNGDIINEDLIDSESYPAGPPYVKKINIREIETDQK